MIDGGSQDSTLDLIEQWKDRLPIILLEHPFDTAGWQRNRGMELCTTDWVFGIDADMTFTKNMGELFSGGFFDKSEVWDFPLYFTVKDEYHCCSRKAGATTRLYKSKFRFKQGHHPKLDVTQEMKKGCGEVKIFENGLLETQRALLHRGVRWQPYQKDVRKVGPSHGKPTRYVEAEFWARYHNEPLPEEVAQLVIPRDTPALRAIDRTRNVEGSMAKGRPPPWVHGWRGGISLFSTCKPFSGEAKIIQDNAIASWVQLPRAEVILVGDDEGTAEAAEKWGCHHISGIEHPTMDKLFALAEEACDYGIICYSHADIIFTSELVRAAKRTSAKFKKFLMVGQRTDMEVSQPLQFNEGWEKRLLEAAEKSGRLHSKHGIDYFVFTKGLYDKIPPFVMGNVALDNYLIWMALDKGVPVVDATEVVTAVHQEHQRGFVVGGGDFRYNKQLANGRIADIGDATWRLTENDIVPA